MSLYNNRSTGGHPHTPGDGTIDAPAGIVGEMLNIFPPAKGLTIVAVCAKLPENEKGGNEDMKFCTTLTEERGDL